MTTPDTIQALTDEQILKLFNAHDEQLKGGSTLFHFNEFARELIAADRAFRALPADKTLAYCRDVRFDGTANERGIANNKTLAYCRDVSFDGTAMSATKKST